jgi:hypothetical protein
MLYCFFLKACASSLTDYFRMKALFMKWVFFIIFLFSLTRDPRHFDSADFSFLSIKVAPRNIDLLNDSEGMHRVLIFS